MAKHKPRYGRTFHDSLYFSLNNKMQGKVFSFEVDSAGLARSQRSIQVNIAEWDDCVACQEFEHCYKLYRAKQRGDHNHHSQLVEQNHDG